MRVLKYKKTDRARNKGQKRHAQNSERQKLHVSTGAVTGSGAAQSLRPISTPDA